MAEEDSQENRIEQLEARIQRLEQENRRWMRRAGTSRLTDLPNSMMLYEIVLPAELRKCDVQGISIACLLLCPDNLGDVNQVHGREVGDGLIKEMGLFLKERLEEGERLFHPDGANFVILMVDAPEGRARRKATETRTDFKEATFTVGERAFSDLTCSIGVALIEGVIRKEDINESVDQLFRNLSERLYRAKQRGGNAIVSSPRTRI